jgi:hypothetical protein
MWEEEGFKGFMRGNGINCLRIVPYSAVQFTTYEQLKKVRVIYRFLEALSLIFLVVYGLWVKRT